MARIALVGCAFLLTTMAAVAEEGPPIKRGKVGLVEVPFSATNEGSAEMGCSVALAHWYSQDLGRAAPRGTLRATLWYDPKDGNVVLLNGLEDQMPVQQLWCGTGARAWSGRAIIRLERKVDAAPGSIHVTCKEEAGRLECR